MWVVTRTEKQTPRGHPGAFRFPRGGNERSRELVRRRHNWHQHSPVVVTVVMTMMVVMMMVMVMVMEPVHRVVDHYPLNRRGDPGRERGLGTCGHRDGQEDSCGACRE
jgi:hypothetical protein